jgi:hypothetical protein
MQRVSLEKCVGKHYFTPQSFNCITDDGSPGIVGQALPLATF